MIAQKDKNKILQVVNVFETGTSQGKYDAISIFADGRNGTRQITFGRSQTTEQGNLRALIDMYIAKGGKFANEFSAFVSKIGRTPLVDNAEFKKLLKKAAVEDVVMRNVQDEFFDTVYFTPALHFFEGNRFTLPLSLLVIYDSYIHSGSIPGFLRNRFAENPPVKGGDEKAWIKAYVNARHNWLATHSRKILQGTIYRTQCFKNQINNDNWNLDKPVNANGVQIA